MTVGNSVSKRWK